MIAILGTGKMGEALLSGLLRAGRPPSAVMAAVRREERAAELRERYGVQVADATSAAKMADTLVLAVKPQDMGRLLEEIAPVVPEGTLVISVAAGITTAFIAPAAVRPAPRRPGDVEHAGARRRGDERDLRRGARRRGAPAAGGGTAPPGRQGAAHSRVAAGRRDRVVGQRPGLRVLPGRVDGGCRHPARHGARHRAGDGHPGGLRRGHHAPRIGRASGDPARGRDLARRNHDLGDQGTGEARGAGRVPGGDRGGPRPRPGTRGAMGSGGLAHAGLGRAR